MSLASFLDRLVAPGNYIAVAFKGNNSLSNRFYPRDQCGDAASFCKWASKRGMDTWYAPASFTEATLRDDGNGYRGRRTQTNVENLKSFWFDADIKRAGDGKDPAKVFADLDELKQWAKDFSQATGFPLPNLWVCSGYGVHLYWTLTDALDRVTWEPYAAALKILLAAHGAKGDLAVVADSARILRPIETHNYKDRTHPAPCYFLLDWPDYPNADVLTKLVVTTGSGKRPKAASQYTTSMAANAQAGMSAAPRDFGLIAQHCPQVALSLAEGGANDGRQLWRGLLTLARFCEYGRDWAHKVGEQHPTYKPDHTDAEFDQIEQEYQAKKFGATLCKTFDTERAGVCATCPHHNKVTTPFQLGLLAGTGIDPTLLPPKYRCIDGRVEMDGGENGWQKILTGEVKNPLLEYVDGEARLTFDYELPAHNGGVIATRVSVTASEMQAATKHVVLAKRGILVRGSRSPIPEMLMAWIDKLREACLHQNNPLPAFGWHREGSFDGFAVAGRFYNADGTTHPANCDDDILKRYSTKGTVASWLTAAKFVISNVPSLHTALALSFGAPLMKLSGAAGGCISFVGPSGIGKTSAFRAGAAVWGNPTTSMLQLTDTHNYRMKFLGEAKAMPVYWDEARLTSSKDGVEQCLEMLHRLTQGRDKGRLGPDLQARDPGTWRTIYALATNASVTELIVNHQGHKSPAMLRVLEVELNHTFKPTPGADRIVDTLEDNYGCAGHEYARYMATHQAEVTTTCEKADRHIRNLLGKWDQDERFHLALASSVIAGAVIARKSLRVPFDIGGIIKVLIESIRRSRADRQEVEPVRQIGVGRVLDDFLNDYASRLIITAQIKRIGGPASPNSLTQPILPTDRMKVPAIQIAVDDKVLRLDKTEFRQWCGLKAISGREMLDLMHQQWHTTGAMRGSLYRGMIGAGERWHTYGNVLLVEIDLDRPELRHILDGAADRLHPPSALPVVGGNVIAMPPRPASPPPTP